MQISDTKITATNSYTNKEIIANYLRQLVETFNRIMNLYNPMT